MKGKEKREKRKENPEHNLRSSLTEARRTEGSSLSKRATQSAIGHEDNVVFCFFEV